MPTKISYYITNKNYTCKDNFYNLKEGLKWQGLLESIWGRRTRP